MLLLIPVWMGIAPVWYEWYGMAGNGEQLKWLYGFLDGRWLVNIPVCLAIGYVCYLWGRRIWTDLNIRCHRLILAVQGIVLLYYVADMSYAKVVWDMDFRMFLTIVLGLLSVVMVAKVIWIKWFGEWWGKRCEEKTKAKETVKSVEEKNEKEVKDKKEDKEVSKGFSDDDTESVKMPEALRKYAKQIAERLLVTNIKKNSFALGVTGEWGVGKTTFLGELKKTISSRVEIVEFNPWMCRTPEQVTNDFFASLRHQLSPKYSTLSRSIKEYAKLANTVTVAPHPLVSAELLLPVKEGSLFERKRALSERFKELPHPVVVVIDDLDRLERDEVFEVLRLIRNTADLSNMLYLVAYDKEYVTCVLEDRSIKDASAYLEKIFPVEVHLPKVEDYLIWSLLKTEIEKQNNLKKGVTDNLFKKLASEDKELILKIIDNYRRAKRFARLFMLNMGYLWSQSKEEMKILDVFWTELLQMYDKRTYDALAEDPMKLLYYDNDRYRLRKGILKIAGEKEDNKYTGEKFWKEETPKVLEKLFGGYSKPQRLSICYAENYGKYFSLSVSPFRLSINELNKLFEKGATPDEVVAGWVNGGKYFSSITYQLQQVAVNSLNDEQLKAYLRGVLHFTMAVSPYNSRQVWTVRKMLLGERYKKGVAQKAHDIVKEWLVEKLNEQNPKEKRQMLYLGSLLNKLYVTVYLDESGKKEKTHPLLISNDEMKELLVKVMESYLSQNPGWTALDVMREDGELACLFKQCCVTEEDGMAFQDYCIYEQVAFSTVIVHFSKAKNKPTQAEYERALGKLFQQETPVFDDPNDEYDYWDYMSEAYDRRMQEYFGSGYDKKEGGRLEEFKAKCFV